MAFFPPNAADNYAAFDDTLLASVTHAVINRADEQQGSHLVLLSVSETKGLKVWDIRDIKPGVYFYTLNVSGFYKTGKIIVSK